MLIKTTLTGISASEHPVISLYYLQKQRCNAAPVSLNIAVSVCGAPRLLDIVTNLDINRRTEIWH